MGTRSSCSLLGHAADMDAGLKSRLGHDARPSRIRLPSGGETRSSSIGANNPFQFRARNEEVSNATHNATVILASVSVIATRQQ